MELTHIDANGNAIMVDVSGKAASMREATACGTLRVNDETYAVIKSGTCKKGDILGVARIAGIMAAKRTSDLVPLCHPLPISKCIIDFTTDDARQELTAICTVKVTGCTGVEMEAITGVSIALITVYDMCKAIDKGMVLDNIHLVHKEGGKSGDFDFDEGGAYARQPRA